MRLRNGLLVWSAGAALTLCAGAALAAAPGGAAGWPTYGGEPGGGHYSSADQIGPGNVNQLEIAWTHNSGDIRERDFEAGVFSHSSF